MDEYLLVANDISRVFSGRWALAGVNLRLRPGSSLLIAGHNGAGKTTLIRLLAGLLRPTTGSVAIAGIDTVKGGTSSRISVAMLGQRNGLYLDLSAYDNLQIVHRLKGSRHHSKQAIAQVLARVGLDRFANVPLRSFSMGMRKRAALASLIVNAAQARLVLLDEPYAQLDQDGFDLVDRLIDDYKKNGCAVVIATHQVKWGARFAKNGLLLEGGKMAWAGSAKDLAERMFCHETMFDRVLEVGSS